MRSIVAHVTSVAGVGVLAVAVGIHLAGGARLECFFVAWVDRVDVAPEPSADRRVHVVAFLGLLEDQLQHDPLAARRRDEIPVPAAQLEAHVVLDLLVYLLDVAEAGVRLGVHVEAQVPVALVRVAADLRVLAPGVARVELCLLDRAQRRVVHGDALPMARAEESALATRVGQAEAVNDGRVERPGEVAR